MGFGYLFAGQGSQFVGMGKDLFEGNAEVQELFDVANEVLGFEIAEVMFEGTEEDLKNTSITQPALFIHSAAQLKLNPIGSANGMAGHSLGEFTALYAAGVLDFSTGLHLVSIRAKAMQKACEQNPGTMAAVLKLEDKMVEEVCSSIDGTVVPANYNCPGQLVISGSESAIDSCTQLLSEKGGRTIKLPVGGAFHSPLMEPASEELNRAIDLIAFKKPLCPIYQNFSSEAVVDPEVLKTNLKNQLTGPVRWTASIQHMIADGIDSFIEVGGRGKVLAGMLRKIDRGVNVTNIGE